MNYLRFLFLLNWICTIEITIHIIINEKIERNVSKRSIAENIDPNENKFESRDDKDCVRELNNLFETFESDDECGNEHNIP